MATTGNVVNVRSNPEVSNLAYRVKRFSDWYRENRAVAICLRYIRYLRDRVHNIQSHDQEAPELEARDLESAECKIIIRGTVETFQGKNANLEEDEARKC